MNFGEPSPCSVDTANRFMVQWVKKTPPRWNRVKDQVIDQVKSAKYSGVCFDEDLNFNEHFRQVKSKLKEAVKALICTRLTLNYRCIILLYNSSSKPFIEYCCIAFLDKISKVKINQLFILQKQAIRLIFNAKRNVHTSKLFELSGIIPITKLYEVESIKMVYKYKFDPAFGELPIAIRELINLPSTNSNRLYNDQNKIKIPSEYKNGHCFYNIIDCLNNCDPTLKMAENLYSLKKMIKEEFPKATSPCNVINCKICQLDLGRNYSYCMTK